MLWSYPKLTILTSAGTEEALYRCHSGDGVWARTTGFLQWWLGRNRMTHVGDTGQGKLSHKGTPTQTQEPNKPDRNLTEPEQHEVLWAWFLRRFIWSDGSALKARLCGTHIETSLMAKGQQIFDEKSDHGKNVTCFTIWLDLPICLANKAGRSISSLQVTCTMSPLTANWLDIGWSWVKPQSGKCKQADWKGSIGMTMFLLDVGKQIDRQTANQNNLSMQTDANQSWSWLVLFRFFWIFGWHGNWTQIQHIEQTKSVEFLRLNLSTMGVSDPYPDQEKAWMVDASRTHAATEEKADKFWSIENWKFQEFQRILAHILFLVFILVFLFASTLFMFCFFFLLFVLEFLQLLCFFFSWLCWPSFH